MNQHLPQARQESNLLLLQTMTFGDDDDFDDFQSAAPAAAAALATKPAAAAFNIGAPASTSTITSSTQFAAPQPHSAAQTNNLNDLFATVSPPPASTNQFVSPPMAPVSNIAPAPAPSGYQASGPNYFTSITTAAPQSGASTPVGMASGSKIGGAAPKKAGGDAFASLLGTAPKKSQTPTQKLTMGDLAKQKTSQGLWGAPASSSSTPTQAPQSGPKPGGALGDLLG